MPDLLPPMATPWLSPDDQAGEMADIFQAETWPSLWPRLVHKYTTTAARDADLAGLGPNDAAFAFVLATRTITAWNGTGWVTVGPRGFADACGLATGFSSGGQAPLTGISANVLLPVGKFTHAPIVVPSFATQPSGTSGLTVRAINVSTASFDLWVNNASATTAVYAGLSVQWIARQNSATASSG